MGRQRTLSTVFPDRPPTWTEATAVVWIPAVISTIFVSIESVSWPAVLAGFLGAVLTCVPTDQTAIGRRIIQWWRRTGTSGRLIVFICGSGSLGVLSYTDWVLREQFLSAMSGFFFAYLIYIFVFIAVADEAISDW